MIEKKPVSKTEVPKLNLENLPQSTPSKNMSKITEESRFSPSPEKKPAAPPIRKSQSTPRKDKEEPDTLNREKSVRKIPDDEGWGVKGVVVVAAIVLIGVSVMVGYMRRK